MAWLEPPEQRGQQRPEQRSDRTCPAADSGKFVPEFLLVIGETVLLKVQQRLRFARVHPVGVVIVFAVNTGLLRKAQCGKRGIHKRVMSNLAALAAAQQQDLVPGFRCVKRIGNSAGDVFGMDVFHGRVRVYAQQLAQHLALSFRSAGIDRHAHTHNDPGKRAALQVVFHQQFVPGVVV